MHHGPVSREPTVNSPRVIRVALCFLLLSGTAGPGRAGAGTNDFGLGQPMRLRSLPAPPAPEPVTFLGRLEAAVDHRADDVFADRLNSLKWMQWEVSQPADSPDWVRERTDRAARRALGKSLEYGLRDALVDAAVIGWAEDRADTLGEFLLGSFDAVEEEELAPFELGYGAVERAWWRSVAERHSWRYGLRPLRTDPYAFLSLQVRERGRPLLLGHARYYFQNLTDHKFELAVSLPLAHGFMLDCGTSHQFGQNPDEQRLVVKLFKPLGECGIIHIGLDVREKPEVLAGLSFSL